MSVAFKKSACFMWSWLLCDPRTERLHASACPPLVTANCDLLVADLIYNLCTQERIISAQFCQMHVHLKDVSWFCFVTRHRKQKSVSSCILFLFCLSTNASCRSKNTFFACLVLTLDITISVLSSNNSYVDIRDRKIISRFVNDNPEKRYFDVS